MLIGGQGGVWGGAVQTVDPWVLDKRGLALITPAVTGSVMVEVGFAVYTCTVQQCPLQFECDRDEQ